MNCRRAAFMGFTLPMLAIFAAAPIFGQGANGGAGESASVATLRELVETPALSGYENNLSLKIRSRLAALHPKIDNLDDVIVTIGSGSPRRLIVTPMDEPGLVVSDITDDGYLRVQRLPQTGLPPIFNQLYAADPVLIETASGKRLHGVVAALSVHLQPGRMNPPKADDLDDMYIDVGASSAAEARKAGIDLLDPVIADRRLLMLGSEELAGTSVGDRFGAAAVIEALGSVKRSDVPGTLIVAFVSQQRTGARGLQRILTTAPADEMLYVGRLIPGGAVRGVQGVRRAPRREPGSGVLIGVEQTDGTPQGLDADLTQLANASKIPIATDYSAGVVPRSYLAAPGFPAKWAHVSIATAWPDTPAETINTSDLNNLTTLLGLYMRGGQPANEPATSSDSEASAQPPARQASRLLGTHSALRYTEVLRRLVESYGVSGHEGAVREEVESLLPSWAKPETDSGGNLILRLGTAPATLKNPSILVVAHMDEIGLTVKTISSDGRLEVTGDEALPLFAGRAALVHSANGDHDAAIELPDHWDDPNFQWPTGRQATIRVDVGAHSPAEVAALGIKPDDTITVPKTYYPMIGSVANARSFDDRVGCTALISAVWALGGPLKDRNVTFVWSTREEVGLFGAAEVAKRLADEGHPPDYVFAVDTFVSSDSPLESKRFADAEVGKGFVIRAIDGSNIVRRDLVDKVVTLARASQIPVQYGVTGGGNDGSAFVRYGSVDVALGWALRYSHSAGEEVDTRDVDSLGRIIAAIAGRW